MSLLQQTLDGIKEKRLDKLSGKFHYVPFDLPKISNRIPVFSKGLYSCITSGSGVGKTTLANFMVFSAIKNSIEKDIPFKVLWFALEDASDKVILNLMSYLLLITYRERVGYLELNSLTDKTLGEDILNKIEELKPTLEKYLERIVINDNLYNPTGIYNEIKKHALENKHVAIIKKDYGGEVREVFQAVKYPEIVTIVIDHMSLLNTSQDCPTLREAMVRMSMYFKQYVTMKFKYSVLAIQQQASDAEGIENYKEKRLVPALSGLGDNKALQRDYRAVLGIYHPARHDVKYDCGYDVGLFDSYYRSIHIIKNTFGESNVAVGTFFDGKTNMVKELPAGNDQKQLSLIYEYVKKISNE